LSTRAVCARPRDSSCGAETEMATRACTLGLNLKAIEPLDRRQRRRRLNRKQAWLQSRWHMSCLRTHAPRGRNGQRWIGPGAVAASADLHGRAARQSGVPTQVRRTGCRKQRTPYSEQHSGEQLRERTFRAGTATSSARRN
jgi:hypothetical protein